MNVPRATLVAMSIATAFALPAQAQPRAVAAPPRPLPHRPASAPPPSIHFDDRYGHNHYYPAPGLRVRTLPPLAVSTPHLNSNWFFHGGAWYRGSGGAFVVDVPPIGLVIPILPPTYVTLWVGGEPYFYANGVYYRPAGAQFAVAAPPAQAVVAQWVPPPMFIYPRLGQDGRQTEADRAACNDWAASQPGTVNDAPASLRAFAACMDGRGYTLR